MKRRMLLAALAALVIGLASGAGTEARAMDNQVSDLSRNALDARIDAALHDAVEMGVRLFNERRDPAGCYRLYQGALIGVRPLLDHRPDLKAQVDKGLRRSESMSSNSDQAFAARALIDLVREEVMKPTRLMTGSLWDRLGGEAAVKAVVHDFVVAAAADPKVNFDRNGTVTLTKDSVAALEGHLVGLISAVSGGPRKYTGRDMKSSHKGMGITAAEFGALAGHLVATLKKYQVPQKEIDELVGIVAGTQKDIVEKH